MHLRDTAVTRFGEAPDSDEIKISSITGHKPKRVGAILQKHYLAKTSTMAKAAMDGRTALEAGEAHGLF